MDAPENNSKKSDSDSTVVSDVTNQSTGETDVEQATATVATATEVPPPPGTPQSKRNVTIAGTQGANLPLNWSTAVSPEDGRVYYWNSVTGATRWTHPNFSTVTPPPPPSESKGPIIGGASGILQQLSSTISGGVYGENTVPAHSNNNSFHAMVDKDSGFHDYDPTQAINSHRVYSICALILFFPLGIFAVIQSHKVVSQWKLERYEQAHDHSQQTLLYSRISCSIGICFWIYFFFFSGPGPFAIEWDWHWPAFVW